MTMANGIAKIASRAAMMAFVMSAPKVKSNAMAIKFKPAMKKVNGLTKRLANPPKHVMQAFAATNAQMETTDVPETKFKSAKIRIGAIKKTAAASVVISTMARHIAKSARRPTQKRSAMATRSRFVKVITNGKTPHAAQMAATAPTQKPTAKNAQPQTRSAALTIISKHVKTINGKTPHAK